MNEPNVFSVKPGGPYDSISKLKAGSDYLLGGFSPQGNFTLATLSVIGALKLRAKVLFGYTGTGDIAMDIAKGELAGAAMTASTTKMRVSLGIQPLFTLAGERTSVFPKVPTLLEAVKAAGGTEEDMARAKDYVDIWDNIVVSKALFTAAGVPPERIMFLRKVFSQVVSDVQVVSEVEKMAGYNGVDFPSGESLGGKVATLIKQKQKVKNEFEDLIKTYRK